MGLGSRPHEDDLPELQLRKWGPSEFPYNPSYFREGFISPTRRLLLLLSYDFDGLLLPLVKGQFINHKGSVNTCDGTFYGPHESSVQRVSVPTANNSSSSEAVELDTGFVHESQPSVSGSTHAFLSDVDSIAWGLSVGSQQEETSFQELLFVSGKHGVVVHVFSQFNHSMEAANSTEASDVGKGMWIEWGPASTLSHREVQGEFKSCPEESSNTLHAEAIGVGQSASSKIWMRTFLAEAERLTLRNTVYTKFPKKPSFPKNVVVSFRIFDKDSQFPEFLSHGRPTSSDQENSSTAVADPINKPMDLISSSTSGDDNASKSRDTSASNLYKCVKVFSDSSFHLVGFALSSISSMHVSTSNVTNQSYGGVLVAVARIITWGLEWIYSVKLDRSMNENPPDWIDFTFSHSFLICLSKSGLISLHGALTGTYIGFIDVVYISSLGCPPRQKLESDDDVLNKMREPLLFQNGGLTNKIRFKRLYVFPQSTLLGVMDECGVIYVLLTDDHVPEEHWSSENFLPYPYQPNLGLLTSWQVGGTEIGFPRALSLDSKPQSKSESTMRGSSLNIKHLKSKDFSIKDWRTHYDSYITNSCGETKIMSQNHMVSGQQPNRLVRKVFLPTSGFSEDDHVCVSPFGITRLIKKDVCEMKLCQVVHTNLQLDSIVKDEMTYSMQGGETSSREAVGCTFHGLLYLVTDKGISVVLPSISIPSKSFPIETIGYSPANSSSTTTCGAGDLVGISGNKRLFTSWKMEVLDRVILYEGYEVAEKLFIENGWELGIARIRRLQLALDYLDFDQIQNSLEMLVGANLAVEGIVRLLFAIVYLMLYKVSNNEASSASRLLAVATSYATMVIRKYGLLQLNVAVKSWDVSSSKNVSHPSELKDKEHDEEEKSKSLKQVAKLLVVIRSLQRQLDRKYKSLGLTQTDDIGLPELVGVELSENESNVLAVTETALLDASSRYKTPEIGTALGNAEERALVPVETNGAKSSGFQNLDGAILFADGNAFGERTFKMENPKDMIARWELNNMDLNTVVKDALLSGRLPLAVLRLHLHRLNNLLPGEETQDSFNDVRIAGRAIAYDLFIKGEIGLAVTTLQKLGEDVETTLKQLLFGTVRRSLRMVVAEEMKRHMYLGSHEWKILETVGLIERVYPCRSFFSTLATRREELKRASKEDASGEIGLCLLHPLFKNLHILCGEIDGVVLGSWITVNGHSVTPEVDDDSNHAAYWVAAVAWADTWDQRVIDRVLLDQPLLMGVHLLWESQLEYYVCHNDWFEVCKLLEVVPTYALTSGSLSIRSDDLHPSSSLEYAQEISGYNNCISFLEELDATYITVPGIRVFRFSANRTSSTWLKMLMEQQLAKKFIFLTDYWHGTADMVALLSKSGFLIGTHENSTPDGANDNSSNSLLVIDDVSVSPETVQALHKVVVRFSAQYNLLNFLDIYLDLHQLATDQDSLSFLLDAAGDNEWAKCLLLLRVKGKEYDASFSNARAVASRNLIPGSRLTSMETEDIIQAVDDIAEGSGEIAALATLMFAPVPLQECLRSGSVNRQYGPAQCTLENLRPALQRFPTMWKTLNAACFGQGSTGISLALKTKVSGYSDLLEYLNWREGVFFSSMRDTSILQMIPYWFPKDVRRLIQLYVQGPVCWQSIADFQTDEISMLRDIYYTINSSGHAQISALSWEAAVQKHIEEELYSSPLEGTEVGLEHHLYRGRALGALNHLLSTRVHKLNSNDNHDGRSATPSTAQTNFHSDVQTLLASISESEQSLLSSVIPLSIEHFDNTVLVASCVFLLELCGLSATTLQIDVAALKRISSFYKSSKNNQHRQLSPSGSVFRTSPVKLDVADSLAHALADDYRHRGLLSIMQNEGSTDIPNQPSRALLVVLQHLEKASLPVSSSGVTCGSWLMSGNGNGNGAQLRSQQKATSQRWQLITAFCKMHGIPLSTKYLGVLARDNDWVGFLSEAQVGKFSFETVIQMALKEFSDPRLKIHILTVLRNMQSRKKGGLSNLGTAEDKSGAIFSDGNLGTPTELFGIIAECENLERPGEALLLKAKNLCWSILAMIASCFHDVSLLSCLTVWLEITAARETSAIKVNDIASQIAKTVGAAVEATNSLPASSRTVIFHYNRKKPKRRHLLEPTPVDSLASDVSQLSEVYIANEDIQGVANEDNKNIPYPEDLKFSTDANSTSYALSKMVSVLSEQHLFLPLLQAFEIFLPSCSLLPFIRALQAFSQMRLSEASAHLGSFASRIKEEASLSQSNCEEGKFGISWTISTSVKAADAMLLTCQSPYERRCLLKLLAATDFGDGGSTTTRYRQQCWKMEMAEPCLRGDECPLLEKETFDDASLLTAFEKNGYWEQARSWAKQLEISGESCWKSATNHVTEMQAEAMVGEWKEFLWDVPEERIALWSHCQTLFIRYSYPAIKAGLFFLKHAELAEKDIPARELHEILLLSLQWLSGMITLSNTACPLHLLHEIETRIWLLAVEAESHVKSEGDVSFTYTTRQPGAGNGSNLIDRTASITRKMDNHLNSVRLKSSEKNDRENNQTHVRTVQAIDSSFSSSGGWGNRIKRRAKGIITSRKPLLDATDKKNDSESVTVSLRDDSQFLDENFKVDTSSWKWEEKIGSAELERAVLSLLDFGQITAARQLQAKLSPDNVPSEFLLVDAALKLASLSTPNNKVFISALDDDLQLVIESFNLPTDNHIIDPLKVLECLAMILVEGSGHGLCKRIISIVKTANVLGLMFMEAFEKQPIELLQLLSLKAQDSFDEASFLVQTHSMPSTSIAQILAESFLKGLLAAHRGGYMDSQKDEGPAPLLWRFSDFLKWAKLCPSESEIGHALMKLVITGQEIPHACEVELLILSHHFYKLSACLDGVDVLVTLAATRVEAYVGDGDFACLARLITGVGNFYALNFILGLLIENGQLDLLLQKYSAAADASSSTAESVRGFRMAVLTSLKQFNPSDFDAFAMVYNHFDMKHEIASLLESRATQSSKQWFLRYDKDQNEDLLESMRYFIEAAEVYSSVDAGNKTRKACAQASLVSLQIRMPDTKWLDLSATNARRILVEQSQFQEAIIVAEAYGLNQPTEWALVLWEQMLSPELIEQFVAEFVAVLPLQPSMLVELARFYRAEMQARGDQSQFSVWLTGGGIPADWAKYLGRSFRCLLKRTPDFRLRIHLALTATGFDDIILACNRVLDKVPENAGPLILRKGHGGAYLPLM